MVLFIETAMVSLKMFIKDYDKLLSSSLVLNLNLILNPLLALDEREWKVGLKIPDPDRRKWKVDLTNEDNDIVWLQKGWDL